MISITLLFIALTLHLLYFAITGKEIEIENIDRITAFATAELFLELLSMIIYIAQKVLK